MVTQDAAIPRAGSATYTGTVIGDYIGDDNTAAGIINGGHYTVTADMSAQANFDSGNVGFSTSNTALSRDYETVLSTPELDLSGELTLSSSANRFAGTIDNFYDLAMRIVKYEVRFNAILAVHEVH